MRLFAYLQSAASDEAEHLHVMTPAPAEAPQGSSTGVQLAVTPATAPRAANPAAFLRNTNSIFSPDVPAEAGLHRSSRMFLDPSQLAQHVTACQIGTCRLQHVLDWQHRHCQAFQILHSAHVSNFGLLLRC